MSDVALATEDELSEAVCERLVEDAGLTVVLRLRKDGFGYLRANMAKWCDLAQRGPAVLLVTDLDRADCAPRLMTDWLGSRPRPERLLFRVAVREVEAWLLADAVGMATLLGSRARVTARPEALLDPKAELLRLARRAPRAVRDDLLADRGAISYQGLGYNHRLCAFVRTTWDPDRASRRSQSLASARQRLQELVSREP